MHRRLGALPAQELSPRSGSLLRTSSKISICPQKGACSAPFFLVRPAGRTDLEVQVLYGP